jgi:hypothetical protein
MPRRLANVRSSDSRFSSRPSRCAWTAVSASCVCDWCVWSDSVTGSRRVNGLRIRTIAPPAQGEFVYSPLNHVSLHYHLFNSSHRAGRVKGLLAGCPAELGQRNRRSRFRCWWLVAVGEHRGHNGVRVTGQGHSPLGSCSRRTHSAGIVGVSPPPIWRLRLEGIAMRRDAFGLRYWPGRPAPGCWRQGW